jgi:hypothetical protein
MSNQPKDLQKLEEPRETFLEKTARDALSKAVAGGILAVISILIALAYGAPYYLYLPLALLVFVLVLLAFFLFSFYPTNKQLKAENALLKAKEEEKSAIEILKTEHQKEIKGIDEKYQKEIEELKNSKYIFLRDSDIEIKYLKTKHQKEIETLKEGHQKQIDVYEYNQNLFQTRYNAEIKSLKKTLEENQWLIDYSKKQAQHIYDFVSVEDRILKSDHNFDDTESSFKIIFAISIFNKSVFKITFENKIAGGDLTFKLEPFLERKRILEPLPVIEPLCRGTLRIEQRLDKQDVAKLKSALQAYYEEVERYRHSRLEGSVIEPTINFDGLLLIIKLADDKDTIYKDTDKFSDEPPYLRMFALTFDLRQIKL